MVFEEMKFDKRSWRWSTSWREVIYVWFSDSVKRMSLIREEELKMRGSTFEFLARRCRRKTDIPTSWSSSLSVNSILYSNNFHAIHVQTTTPYTPFLTQLFNSPNLSSNNTQSSLPSHASLALPITPLTALLAFILHPLSTSLPSAFSIGP
jgi:hypothetical protein